MGLCMNKLILRASQVGSTKSEKYRDVFMEGFMSRVSQGLLNTRDNLWTYMKGLTFRASQVVSTTSEKGLLKKLTARKKQKAKTRIRFAEKAQQLVDEKVCVCMSIYVYLLCAGVCVCVCVCMCVCVCVCACVCVCVCVCVCACVYIHTY